jgi:flagellar motor switch protein FliG
MSDNVILAEIRYSKANRVFHNLTTDQRREVLMRLQDLESFDVKLVKKVVASVKRSH